MENDYYANALGNLNGFDKVLFERALEQWTERPQLGNGYNKRNLKLYDSLIWTRVENTREELKRIQNSINERRKSRKNSNYCHKLLMSETDDDLLARHNEINNDIKNWKYTGRVYRAIGCKKGQVEYHGLIASWVSNLRAFDSFNHLYKRSSYTFLIGKTCRDWGFDVNKYRAHTGNRHLNTEHESEIILPMDKKYINNVFYGTLEDFYKYVKTKR